MNSGNVSQEFHRNWERIIWRFFLETKLWSLFVKENSKNETYGNFSIKPRGPYFFHNLLGGGLNIERGGGGLFQINTKRLILFYLLTDLILNKIQKRTSVVTTELW